MGGLDALHKVGRFHGNLKPTNVLVFGAGDEIQVKLSDFENYPGNAVNH